MTVSETLVIGVGNAFRGDDVLGLFVARQLRALALEGVTILEQSGEGTALVEAWNDAAHVIVVDAVSSGSEPGTIHRFEAVGQPLPAHFSGGSTHALGLVEAIELARRLDRLPDQLIVYGVEGKSFEFGTGLSTEVEAAAEILRERIVKELSHE